jgi:anti-sigma factor RsiW
MIRNGQSRATVSRSETLLVSSGSASGASDPIVAALLAKRRALADDLAAAEDTVAGLRRQIAALSETLKAFGHAEPERDTLPAAVKHKRSKEGFRKGELTRRVLEKVRDAAEPVRPIEVARAIMAECLMDAGDQTLAVAFQHKVHNVIRRQWGRGILERVGGDGWTARWKVAAW